MNADAPIPSLDSQWLTPEKVAWLLDISVRTLRDWNRRRVIPFDKFNDLVRYDPAEVLAYLKRNRRASRGLQTPAGAAGHPGEDMDWQRIGRLIQLEVESHLTVQGLKSKVQSPETERQVAA